MNTKNEKYSFHKEILKKNIHMAYRTNCNLISVCCGDSDFVTDCIKSCGIKIYYLGSNAETAEFSEDQLLMHKEDTDNNGRKKAIFIEHSKRNYDLFYNFAQNFIEKIQNPLLKVITVFKEKEIDEDLLNTFFDDHHYVIYSNQREKLENDNFTDLLTTRSGMERIKIIHPALFLAISYIIENIYEDITLEKVSKASYVSSSHLSYLFRTKLNTKFKSILFTLKVIEAREIIRSTPNKNFTEIALDLGFYDLSHFGKVFKKYEGMSIGEFRKNVIDEGCEINITLAN
ncbi:TPA: helix-turn-helix transcriptional regulator [Vibrio parahaemolyticus]|uniref:helix-turn-helix transcriptional regulator n=1 Tax=Vibrio parahaemolyticus TaxID=670 RepID=UPI00111CC79A|nr:AraC family transcriptional regulator [Vibrio parahaemolyticus]TOG38278.1 hypothetical protein CGJ02_25400 [Vibrio parahaemolyticus]HBN6205824.1 helix-turn-helix transcriptional regulator [Vibrio parahaemolyticus]HCH4062464.1 helix-turn-helix transcriptional regulator [Vibrio parahaemolyticus]